MKYIWHIKRHDFCSLIRWCPAYRVRVPLYKVCTYDYYYDLVLNVPVLDVSESVPNTADPVSHSYRSKCVSCGVDIILLHIGPWISFGVDEFADQCGIASM